jgi:hypothetical protein
MLRSTTSLASRFRFLQPNLAAGPAPLYAHLVARAADELDECGRLWELLRPWEDEPDRLLFPLRLLAAVHRWVLAGDLPELAEHYPNVGGDLQPEGSWPLFREAVLGRARDLPGELAGVNQHNEVARAAPLSLGFVEVARRTGLPMRILEVGTSAGLLLRWDAYRELSWWDDLFEGTPPCEPAKVVERRGCDLNPVDPTTEEGALRLRSFVWADLVEHLRMLDEAIQIAGQMPAEISRADGADWLDQVAGPQRGVATVVFHSLMTAASDPASLSAMSEVIQRKAAEATPESPLAHLRFETGRRLEPGRLAEVRLTMWPGGEERLLATADVNGRTVRPVAG